MSCPACGNPVALDARFCAVCGHRLAGRTEERRLVTVVFADLVGFTTLSEHRDPEQVKHLVDRCFSWLAADIVNFGGRVDKVMGDAIVALFGAPTAHEDDAERAVRAALQMQTTLRQRANELDHAVQLRIGVNSGEVLVGEMQAAGDYTAMGDVVNTASRLQTAAEPGEVLVGPDTHAATGRVIRYRHRGPLQAKGREAPVEAFSALEPAVEPGSRARSRVSMVGRTEELELLRSAAANALRHGRAALLLVAGDAGMGKTRLADELTSWAAASFGTLGLEGRCLPYGEANVWWPISEALRRTGKVDLGASLDEAQAALREVVAQNLDTDPDEPEVQRIVDGLVQVLGYDEARRDPNPERGRDAVVAAVVALLGAASSRQPVVMQLSDLHWADEVVLALIASVFERLPRHPIVLVATTRRSLLARWTPPSGRHDTVVLNLEALDQDASTSLLDSLLEGRAALDEADRQRLIERAGGNPFFLEELVSLAAAQEHAPASADLVGSVEPGVELPGTLRGLLTARLDRLSTATRAVVDDAAFIGRRGPVEALATMAVNSRGVSDIRPALDQLAESDLLVIDGDQWSFRSDLLREVAYSTLTKHERARRHEEIARWIEAHLPLEVSDSIVDQLANHWSSAAELGEELGTRRSFRSGDGGDGAVGVADPAVPALRWLEEAAERAERMRALRVAERLYDRALGIVTLLPDNDVKPAKRVDLLIGRARSRAEERELTNAKADADEALELARAAGSASGEAAALLVAGDIANKAGDVAEAISVLRVAADRYEDAGDLAGRGEALRARAMAELFAGRFADADRTGRAALNVFDATGDPRRKAWTLQNLAWIAFQSGRPQEAVRYLHESMDLFRDLDDRGGLHWAEGLFGFVSLQLGDFAEAQRLQAHVLGASRKAGDRWATAMMVLLGSLVHLWTGRTELAVDDAREALAMFEAMDDRFGRGNASSALGRALIMTGSASEGVTLLESTLDLLRTTPGASGEVEFAMTVLAASLVHLGEPERALAAAGLDVSALVEPAGVDLSVLAPTAGDELAVALAMAALQLGQPRAAETWLEGLPDRPYATAVRALLRAVTGDAAGARALAQRTEAGQGVTYLDSLLAGLATGLAAAGEGDHVGSEASFASLRDALDATDDQLSRAIAVLGEAWAFRLLGDPAGEARETDASVALRRHGAVGPGWAALFASVGSIDTH